MCKSDICDTKTSDISNDISQRGAFSRDFKV